MKQVTFVDQITCPKTLQLSQTKRTRNNESISKRIIETEMNISDISEMADKYWSQLKVCFRKVAISILENIGNKCTNWVLKAMSIYPKRKAQMT